MKLVEWSPPPPPRIELVETDAERARRYAEDRLTGIWVDALKASAILGPTTVARFLSKVIYEVLRRARKARSHE